MALDESQGIANQAEILVPSDVTVFNEPSVIWVGVSGTVYVDMAIGGTNIPFVGAFGGTTLPVLVTRVYATGTTATDMIRLF
jgi:hypothetical protein